MFQFLVLSFMFISINGLPRDLVDLAMVKNGLTNVDIAKILDQAAENLDNRQIALEDIQDRAISHSFLIEVTTELTLIDGYLSNISSFELKDKITRLDTSTYEIPLRFKVLEFGYHYDAEIGWTTHYGNISGRIHDFDITLPLHFCGSKLNLMKVDPFKYRDIEIKYQSDSIITKVFTTITSIFEDIIIHLLQDMYARTILTEITNEMNNILTERFNKVL